ncbi:MAG: SRPBCC family protein [Deltaproteobacteria bacterium]|nr:SRPBCC family protein [Deltaproteobacteria bacterium]
MNSITATRNIPANAATVWALVSDVTTVQAFHPRVQTVDLLSDAATGLGATRRCNFYDGTSVVEVVDSIEEGRRVHLTLSEYDVPMKSFEAAITLKPLTGGQTQVSMILTYSMKFGVLGKLMDVAMVRGQMSKLMNEVLAGMAHHLRTGETVGENTAMAA